MPKNWKGDPLGFFNIQSVAKHQKIEGEKFLFSEKKSRNAGKIERGDPLRFFNIHSVAKQPKNEGGPFGEKKSEKKSRRAQKSEWGMVSPGMVCYAGKREKPFWFNSLCQMVQLVQ